MTMPGGALDPMGGEITYTPTTHRISKAKKGKKVHACEYPGCTKVRWISDLAFRGNADLRIDLHTGRASQVWNCEIARRYRSY